MAPIYAAGIPQDTMQSVLLRRRLAMHALHVLTNVLLEDERHFIAIDLAAGIGMPSDPVGVGGAQLLLARGSFNHHLAGDILRSLSDDLGQFAHGLQLFGFFESFRSVLTPHAGF